MAFEGRGTREEASKQVPQKEKSCPESTMFGVLPAYGFYCRHVKGLKLTNVSLQTAAAHQRHALVCEDVEDVLINALDAPFASGACSVIRLNNAKGVFIRGCRPKEGTDLFLNLQGPQSKRVLLMANDLSTVAKIENCEDGPRCSQDGFGPTGQLPCRRITFGRRV